MTPFERYLRTLEGKECDCLPRTPILMQFAAEYIGSDYGTFASDYKVLAQANERCATAFGFDQWSAISDPYREASGFGGEITFVSDGVPRYHSPLEDIEEIDFSLIREPHPLEATRMRDRVEGIRLMRKNAGRHYSVMGWVEGPAAEAADLRGVSQFLMDLIDEPEDAARLVEMTTNVAISFALAQIEAGADTIGVGEAIASQVSPELYRTIVLPHTRRLVEAIRHAGAYVKIHICGNITHLLGDLSTLPINVLDLDHLVDPVVARARMGTGVVLCTNLDPVTLLQRGKPGDIRQKMAEVYAQLGNPCIINAGCEIPAGTPVENLRALCEPLAFVP